MKINEAMLEYRKSKGISQQEIADKIHLDRSLISKVENGKESFAEYHDSDISNLNWRLALTVIDERSGGYISNILDEIPDLDLNPSSLKEILTLQLDELEDALGKTRLARHIPIEKQKKQAEMLWMEIKDVVDYAAIMLGVIEEQYQLDTKRLRLIYKKEVKERAR